MEMMRNQRNFSHSAHIIIFVILKSWPWRSLRYENSVPLGPMAEQRGGAVHYECCLDAWEKHRYCCRIGTKYATLIWLSIKNLKSLTLTWTSNIELNLCLFLVKCAYES